MTNPTGHSVEHGCGGTATKGLWKLPDLWTRKRTRAHEVLGRRQTDVGAHSYHRPQARRSPQRTKTGKHDPHQCRCRRPGGLNLWTALRSSALGRRPQVSVSETARRSGQVITTARLADRGQWNTHDLPTNRGRDI